MAEAARGSEAARLTSPSDHARARGIERIMKSSGLSLLFAISMLAPNMAEALPVETPFTLSIVSGPNEVDATEVATVTFRLVEDLGAGCRYSAGWQGRYDGASSTPCSIDESKAHGHASCVSNAGGAFPTLLVKAPRLDCAGFDTMAQTHDIALLVALVAPDEPSVMGLLIFAGGWPIPYAFMAEAES